MKTNEEMIFEVTKQIEHSRRKQKSRKKMMTVIAVISVFLCLGIAVGAAAKYAVLSPEWRDQLVDNAQNATEAIGVDEFKEKLAASDDKFSKDEVYPVLMDYENAIKIGVTQQSGDYVFTLDSIVPGQWLRNKVVSGSLANVEELKFEWQVTDAYFAIFEISRADGQPINEETDPWFHWHRYVAGYNPWGMNMCLEGAGEFSVFEDGKKWTAVVITDMMMFADHDFVFAPVDLDAQFDPVNDLYADAEGTIEIKNTAPETVVLLRCKIDDKFADKAAQQEFMEGREYLTKFNGYEK
ncbi:MAG: hypothetical protein IKJ63_09810 [Clostridia bacterium]|nr:hypothetical protein [Clostridia bacterium]